MTVLSQLWRRDGCSPSYFLNAGRYSSFTTCYTLCYCTHNSVLCACFHRSLAARSMAPCASPWRLDTHLASQCLEDAHSKGLPTCIPIRTKLILSIPLETTPYPEIMIDLLLIVQSHRLSNSISNPLIHHIISFKGSCMQLCKHKSIISPNTFLFLIHHIILRRRSALLRPILESRISEVQLHQVICCSALIGIGGHLTFCGNQLGFRSSGRYALVIVVS